MTKGECAIVTAYTGISMLQGQDVLLLYEYAEKKLGRPIMTHHMASDKFWEELKNAAEVDFIDLCLNADAYEDEVFKLKNEINQWRNIANSYEQTILRITGLVGMKGRGDNGD